MDWIIEGEVHRICKPFEHESGFRRCAVHVKITDGKYSQIIPLEFLQDMTDEAMTLTIGSHIKAHCNLRGREYINKQGDHAAFMNLQVWNYDIEEKTIKQKVMEKAQQAAETEVNDMPWDK
tara:strand:+ start:9618 stop:9980 length:363 start_codon:yes stop_codon:yes gene_type:complete